MTTYRTMHRVGNPDPTPMATADLKDHAHEEWCNAELYLGMGTGSHGFACTWFKHQHEQDPALPHVAGDGDTILALWFDSTGAYEATMIHASAPPAPRIETLTVYDRQESGNPRIITGLIAAPE